MASSKKIASKDCGKGSARLRGHKIKHLLIEVKHGLVSFTSFDVSLGYPDCFTSFSLIDFDRVSVLNIQTRAYNQRKKNQVTEARVVVGV